MRRKVELQIPEGGSSQPVSRPSQAFIGGRSQPADLSLIREFSELSGTLRTLFQAQGQRQANKQHSEGQAAFVQGTEEEREEIRKKYGQLIREGKIDEAENPFFLIGWTEAAARADVQHYASAVQARMAEATTVADGQDRATAAEPLERIMAEEWGHFSDSPAATSFYGRRAASHYKEQVDAQMLDRASREYRENLKAHKRRMATNEVRGLLRQLSEADDPAEALADIQAYDRENLHGVHKDPLTLVVAAAESEFLELLNIDPESASDFLDRLETVQVGSTKLGADAEVDSQIERWRRVAEAEESEGPARAARKRAARTTEVRSEVRDLALLPMLEALESTDGSVTAIYEALKANLEATYESDADLTDAREYLLDLHDSVQGRRRSSPESLDDIDLQIALGDHRSAEALLESALGSGDISGADYGKYATKVAAMKSRETYTVGFGPYQQQIQRINDAASVLKSPSEQLGSRLNRERLETLKRLSDAYGNMVSDLIEQNTPPAQIPEIAAEWLRENADGVVENMLSLSKELKGQQDQVLGEYARAVSGMDMSAAEQAAASGLQLGVISRPEYEAMLADAEKRTDLYGRLGRSNAFNQALATYSAQVAEEAAPEDALRIQSAAQAELRTKVMERLESYGDLTDRNFDQRVQRALDESVHSIAVDGSESQALNADLQAAEESFNEQRRFTKLIEAKDRRGLEEALGFSREELLWAKSSHSAYIDRLSGASSVGLERIRQMAREDASKIVKSSKAWLEGTSPGALPEDHGLDQDAVILKILRLGGFSPDEVIAGEVELDGLPYPINLGEEDPFSLRLFDSIEALAAFQEGRKRPRLFEALGLSEDAAEDFWRAQSRLIHLVTP